MVEEDEGDIDDNEDDWITPSNIAIKHTESLQSTRVGCATTDFAVQNMLLQVLSQPTSLHV